MESKYGYRIALGLSLTGLLLMGYNHESTNSVEDIPMTEEQYLPSGGNVTYEMLKEAKTNAINSHASIVLAKISESTTPTDVKRLLVGEFCVNEASFKRQARVSIDRALGNREIATAGLRSAYDELLSQNKVMPIEDWKAEATNICPLVISKTYVNRPQG